MGIFSNMFAIVINQILDVFKKTFPSLETKQIQEANFYFWLERNCKDMLAKDSTNMAINLNTITCLIPSMYNALKEKTPPTVFSLYWLVRHVLFSLCRKYCVKTSNVCKSRIHCQGKIPYRSNIFTFYGRFVGLALKGLNQDQWQHCEKCWFWWQRSLLVEVTNISHIYQLASFVKYFYLKKRKTWCFYRLFRSFKLFTQHVLWSRCKCFMP